MILRDPDHVKSVVDSGEIVVTERAKKLLDKTLRDNAMYDEFERRMDSIAPPGRRRRWDE